MTGGFLVLGLAALTLGSGSWRRLAVSVGFLFILAAIGLGLSAAADGRGNLDVLEYAAPVVAAGGEVVVEIGNVAPWQARTGWGTYLLLVLGLAVVARGWRMGNRWWRSCGLAWVGVAFLSIHGGAALFFGVVALMALAWWLPRMREVLRGFKRPRVSEALAVGIALAACRT